MPKSLPKSFFNRRWSGPVTRSASGDSSKGGSERRIIEHGYFHELTQLSRTKGKPFVAANSINSVNEAKLFPYISGESLTGKAFSLPAAARGKVSLVALSFKQFGFVQLPSWIEPFQKDVDNLKTSKKIQVVQISATGDGFVQSLLKGSMIGGLRNSIPQARQVGFIFFFIKTQSTFHLSFRRLPV